MEARLDLQGAAEGALGRAARSLALVRGAEEEGHRGGGRLARQQALQRHDRGLVALQAVVGLDRRQHLLGLLGGGEVGEEGFPFGAAAGAHQELPALAGEVALRRAGAGVPLLQQLQGLGIPLQLAQGVEAQG